MEIDPGDFMDRAFYLHQYDPVLVHSVPRLLTGGGTCIDIGAHKGYVTMLFARAVGLEGKVFAFEPDEQARAFLLRNCRHNGMQNVQVFDCALGQEDGTCTFALSSQMGWSSRFPNQEARPTIVREIEIPLRSLDGLIASGDLAVQPERVQLIKIDAEGSEPFVLAGMRTFLAVNRPVLWLEINHGSLKAAGSSAHELERQLANLGYGLFAPRWQRRGLVLPYVYLEPVYDSEQQVLGNTDVVAFPRSAAGVDTRLRRFEVRAGRS